MAERQRRTPHKGFRARAAAIALAVSVGVLMASVDAAEAYCNNGGRFGSLLGCDGPDPQTRTVTVTPPPPPPPSGPEMDHEDWRRIVDAWRDIEDAFGAAERLDSLSRVLAEELQGDRSANRIDFGVGYVPPENGEGPLDSLTEFETLVQESRAWGDNYGAWELYNGVRGELTGRLSLRMSLGVLPRSGPEWGEWQADLAEGIAEIAAQRIVSFQGRIIDALDYRTDSLDPQGSLGETIRDLAADAADEDESLSAFTSRAQDEIGDKIRTIRAGVFGGQQGPVPPVAVKDVFAVDPFVPTVLLTAAQLLDNDSDPNGDSFRIISVSRAVNGSVELVEASQASASSARVVFTPDLSFYEWGGAFSYTIRDSRGQEAPAVVQMMRSRVPPIAHDDTVFIRPRSFTIIPVADLLANDEAQDGRTLTINRVSDSRGGAAAFNGSSIMWHADDGAAGGSFTYHVWDALGAGISGTVTLVPHQGLALELNAAPEAGDDLVIYPTGEPAIVITLDELFANDSDPERRPLELERSYEAVNGIVVYLSNQGAFVFRLDEDSTSGSFRYMVADPFGASDIATVTVQRYDRPPVTRPDLVTVDPETVATDAMTIGPAPYADVTIPAAVLLGNDRDPEELPLRLAAVEDPRNGTVRIDGDSIVFTPKARDAGETVVIVDGQAVELPPEETYGIHGGSFAYLAEDPYGNRTREWVNLSVTSGQPVANDDELAGFVNAPTLIPVDRLLRNDDHPNDRPITLELVRDPVNGGAAYVPGGNIEFEPGPDFAAEGGGFTYQVADSSGGRDTAVVHLTPGNALPEPVDDNMAVSRSEPTAIDVGTLLANDVEPDGEALRVVAIENTRGGEFTLEYPGSGALTLRGENDFQALVEVRESLGGAYRPQGLRATGGNLVRFQPGPDFAETGARFDYVVMDDRYGRTTATVLLFPGNEAPVGQSDLIVRPRADRYEIAAVELTANDTDADGDPISIRSVSSGSGGVASLSADGETVVFEPAAASASGLFTYVVADSMGGESFSTVTVQQAVGVPEAVNDLVDVTGEGPWRIPIADLMANDRDPAGDGLTFGGIVETGPAGQASFDGVSAFVLYEPAPGEDADRASITCSSEGGAAGPTSPDAWMFAGIEAAAYADISELDTASGSGGGGAAGSAPLPAWMLADTEAAAYADISELDTASGSGGGGADPASCQSTEGAAHTFRYRINTVRGSAVGAVTLRPAQDRPAPEAGDDRVEIVFSDANEAFIPVSRLLANDRLPGGDAAILSVIDVFDTDGVYGYLSDDGETVVLGAGPTFATNVAASADQVGGGFRYRIGDGQGGFATAQVTLTAGLEREDTPEPDREDIDLVAAGIYVPDPGSSDQSTFRVDNAQFDVELIQAVLVSGDASPFLPQNPLGGTPLGTDAGSADYSGTYFIDCVVVSDAASIDADFGVEGSHPLGVAQTAGTLSLTSDTPLLGIAGPFPNPPEFALSGAVSDGFGGTLSSTVTGRFVEPDLVSMLYQLSYPGSSTITSDFQCDGRRQ
ncbi:Ig-like domain-containing protein [Inquilinus sp. CAU 1745]|uniref:Ig-like domain-containing protein n=1 Tax=Inquilinus sp. CAU 1745 TaxID=3140369 RepID=UPI00325C2F21